MMNSIRFVALAAFTLTSGAMATASPSPMGASQLNALSDALRDLGDVVQKTPCSALKLLVSTGGIPSEEAEKAIDGCLETDDKGGISLFEQAEDQDLLEQLRKMWKQFNESIPFDAFMKKMLETMKQKLEEGRLIPEDHPKYQSLENIHKIDPDVLKQILPEFGHKSQFRYFTPSEMDSIRRIETPPYLKRFIEEIQKGGRPNFRQRLEQMQQDLRLPQDRSDFNE